MRDTGFKPVIFRLKHETHAASKEAVTAAETTKSEYAEEAILDKIKRPKKADKV